MFHKVHESNSQLKDQVLDATDIVEVIGERVSLTRKGKDFVGLCPFHSDSKPSMYVSPTKRIFKCFACGAGGDVIKFVQLSQRVEFREALGILAKRAGLDLRQSDGTKRSAALRESLRSTLSWARGHFQKNLAAAIGGGARAYAGGRGISDESIERFGLGLALDGWDDVLAAGARAGLSRERLTEAGLITTNERGKTYDRFRNRLIFPIRDALGRVVAFGGRTLGDEPAKYLNSPESPLFSKSRVLYGLDTARPALERVREVVVVEGYTDALLLQQFGIENVVATLGTALTDAHVKLLTPFADTVVMCFDRDQAGMRAADRALEVALRHGIDVKVALMAPGQDPADCVIGDGPDAFKSMLQSAVGALEFKWQTTLERYRDSGERGKRQAIESLLAFLAQTGVARGFDPLAQGLLVARLSEVLALPPAAIYESLARAKASVRRDHSVYTPDTSDTSAYEESIRGLPAGLISVMEELIGVVLVEPAIFPRVESVLATGVGYNGAWQRLFGVVGELMEKEGAFSRESVLRACDDAPLCELICKSVSRVSAEAATPEFCDAVSARLGSELDLLRIENLRGRLSESEQSDEQREQAFRSLLDAARPSDNVLAAAQRWQLMPRAN